MPTGTVPRATVSRVPGSEPPSVRPPARPVRPVPPPAADTSSAVRGFLMRYGAALLPLLATLVAVELGWQLLDGAWPAAAAAVTGWALAVAAWLRRCSWRAGTVLAVIGAPATVLAGPVALGWSSPGGVVLWGPVTTVLAVALVLAVQPSAAPGSYPADG